MTDAPPPDTPESQGSANGEDDQSARRDDSAIQRDARSEGASTPATEGFVLTIGDIGVTRNLIVTPNGNAPLAGSRWIVLDHSRIERRIPTWAIVLAVIFAFACLLGLLFLLVKEDRTTGYVEVSVMSGSLSHVTQVPVGSEQSIAQIRQRVHQAQTLAAAAQA
jgi:hypothetical protein